MQLFVSDSSIGTSGIPIRQSRAFEGFETSNLPPLAEFYRRRGATPLNRARLRRLRQASKALGGRPGKGQLEVGSCFRDRPG